MRGFSIKLRSAVRAVVSSTKGGLRWMVLSMVISLIGVDRDLDYLINIYMFDAGITMVLKCQKLIIIQIIFRQNNQTWRNYTNSSKLSQNTMIRIISNRNNSMIKLSESQQLSMWVI